MKKKVIETLEYKKSQLKVILEKYDEFNNGSKDYNLNELFKYEIEIKSQISILEHLLSE
jgi:GTP-binding protein EngB required for normal cell division